MTDRFGRIVDYLRVSVTDRCNLRCVYCMAERGVEWVPRGELLTYEEVTRICRVFASLGVRTVRLTGGEPLTRRGLNGLVRMLKDAGLTHQRPVAGRATGRAGISGAGWREYQRQRA